MWGYDWHRRGYEICGGVCALLSMFWLRDNENGMMNDEEEEEEG